MPNVYIKKDGTIVTYDTKIYNKKSYIKRREEILKKVIRCEICDVRYALTNATNLKSAKHLMSKENHEYKNKIQELENKLNNLTTAD